MIAISGGVLEALCAEPAITAFLNRSIGRARVTVCSRAADLYVGHPRISAILYRPEDAPAAFDKMIKLEAQAKGPLDLVRQYGRQLDADCQSARPHVHVTTMDRLRLGRFALKQLQRPTVAILLPEGDTDVAAWDLLAADIEERLSGSVLFVSVQKHPALRHGKNLTGRLMPREMAAALLDADGWIGLTPEAAALGWAARRPGVVFTDVLFDSPDESIVICKPILERESLLETLSGILEEDEGIAE